MRKLAIAYGSSRQAKKWVNKTISLDELKERLKVTIRTPESAEEYSRFNKAQKDNAKDHGGFVAGALKGGRRKIDTVELRSMIALDGDRIDKAFLENYESIAPYTSVLYSTHSSTADNPRVRLIFPLTRDVTPEEFVAVSRYLAQMLGIDYFDECSYQPNQLMYWPSTPSNGDFVYKETDKKWLNPDEILEAHPEWRDPTRLPTSPRESKANTVSIQKVQNPLEKEGIVGLFNRVYSPISKGMRCYYAG
jgi:putative DNA primase/helicase